MRTIVHRLARLSALSLALGLGAWTQPAAAQDVPLADLLDVEFYTDGTAADVSPMGNEVRQGFAVPTVYYNEELGRNVATFKPTPFTATGDPEDEAYRTCNYGVFYYDAKWAATFGAPSAKNQSSDSRAIALAAALDECTMECYCKLNAATSSEFSPFSGYSACAFGFTQLSISSGMNFVVGFSSKGNYGSVKIGGAPALEVGQWTHLVGTYSKSQGVAKFYFNGQLVGSYEDNSALKRGLYPQQEFFCIGGAPDWAYDLESRGWNYWKPLDQFDAFDGDVAIARLYGTPLDADEVAALYANARTPVEAGPAVQDSVTVPYYNIESAREGGDGELIVDNTSAVNAQYNFTIEKCARDNQAAQWRLVRLSPGKTAIINRATGNSISSGLTPQGAYNLPDADPLSVVPKTWSFRSLGNDQFAITSQDGYGRYFCNTAAGEAPSALNTAALANSPFAWAFSEAGWQVGIGKTQNAATAANISVSDGRITVSGGAKFTVTSADGMRQNASRKLAPGVYVVTTGGKSVKVNVK